MNYLYKTYVQDFCRCFMKCYINEVLNLNNTDTCRDKGANAILKK